VVVTAQGIGLVERARDVLAEADLAARIVDALPVAATDWEPGVVYLTTGTAWSGFESGEAQLKTGNLNIDEKEFREIMSREFGPARKAVLSPVTRGVRRSAEMRSEELKKDLLIVDAYNIIFAWDRLKKIASGGSLSAARDKLIDILSNYGAFRGCETLVVFDGYKVKEGPGSKEASGGLNIVYTKQGESADVYIEKFLQRIGRNYRVRVATSDSLIQLTALRMGVIRVSARELELEIERAEQEISELSASSAGAKKLGELTDLQSLLDSMIDS